jgi:hypothetical protein
LQRVADDLADLVVVDAALYRDDQRGRDVVTFEVLQRLEPHAPQVGAAQLHERVTFERIELQIDFEPALPFGEPGGKIRLLRDPDAVGVHHHVADRSRPHQLEHVEEFGMQRRLAARELHQVGLALARHQCVDHALDRRQR